MINRRQFWLCKHHYQGYELTRNVLLRESISEAWVTYAQVRLTISLHLFLTPFLAAYVQGRLTIE